MTYLFLPSSLAMMISLALAENTVNSRRWIWVGLLCFAISVMIALATGNETPFFIARAMDKLTALGLLK